MRPTVLLVLLAAASANAQYSSFATGRSFNNPMSAMMDTMIQQSIERKLLEKALLKKYGDAPAPAAKVEVKPTPSAPLAATDFKPGPHTVAAKFGDLAATPEDKRALAAACAQILEGIEGQPDFRKNNVAYGLAVLIGVSIQLVYGKTIPDAEAEQLARDLNDSLAATPNFRKLPAKDRQLLYETSVITAGLMVGLNQEGLKTGDASMQEKAKDMARQMLAMFMPK